MAGFIWTIIVLALIYGAIGLGAEFINAAGDDDSFAFDKKTLIRILKWPKHVFGGKSM